MAAIAQDTSLSSLASLLQGINSLAGTTTTSSVSQQGQQALLANILGSTQGLAQVASGQKTAGLYNSTVNTQMINDLLARSTAQVAAENKTTTTKSNLTSGNNLTKIALALGGKTLLSKGGDYLKTLLQGGSGTDGTALSSALSGGSVGAPAGNSVALLNAANSGDFSGISSNVLAGSGLDLSALNGAVGTAGDTGIGTQALFTTVGDNLATSGLTTAAGQGVASLGGGTLSTALNSGDSGLSTLLGTSGNSLGATIDLGGSSAASGFADSAASSVASDAASSALSGAATDASSVIPYIGPLIGAGTKAAQGDDLGAIGTGVGAAVGSIIPGLGTALGAGVGGFVGSNIGSVSDWKSSLTDPDAIALGVPGLGDLSTKLTGAVSDPSQLPGISSVLGGLGGFGSAIGSVLDAPGSFVSNLVSDIGSFFGGLF